LRAPGRGSSFAPHNEHRRNAVAEAGLFIGWGTVVRGREQRALEVFNESMQYYGGLEQDGRIESWEVVLLEPHGGDLGGFVLLRGSVDQVNALRFDDEFLRLTQRAELIVESIGVVGAFVEDGVARGIGIFQEEVAALG
jgi:hypothetical protein